MGALAELATFVQGVGLETTPRGVLDKAKACLLYGLVIGIGGATARHPRAALAAIDADGAAGSRGAVSILDGSRRPVGAAAFCNAVLLHSRIQEDAHPAGHVGVVVVPAALAACEGARRDGATLLSSIIAGYETALRVGREHSADLSVRGFRTTPIYGAIGAAAAAARAERLSEAETANAIALAANFCGGLREFVDAGTDEYPFQAGFGAKSGLLSASLAAQGVRAATTTFSGRAGFFRAFGREDREYERAVLAGLGREFELMRVTYKPYPVCQFHRGIVKGASELKQRAAGAELVTLRIRMNPFESEFVGVRYTGPFESFPQTFMSAPFCAALAWTRGGVTFAGLQEFNAPDVLSVIPRVVVEGDPLRPRYRPQLEVTLDDGRTESWEELAGEEAYVLDWSAALRTASCIADEVGMPDRQMDLLAASIADLEKATTLDTLLEAAVEACRVARRGSGRGDAASQTVDIGRRDT